MIKICKLSICKLSLSPVFKNSPLKSVQWFNSYFATNFGNSNITARTTGSPSQCANSPWVHSPRADLIWPLQNWGAEVLPHPYWPVLSVFSVCPLFCADLRSEGPGKRLWLLSWQSTASRNACQRQSWSLWLWSQLLAAEKFWSKLVLAASSSTWGTSAALGPFPHQKWTWGILFKLGSR